ncbi:MAG: nucleoprotein/polynucleotide-associated enzyme [Pseudomonadales bacterium RIFCSPHIGHO2_02_FULL_60_43]|nr:MAG: nucleoprotein/polynucleotide-associated enzyme [Pseudomonadales bacterium RIFCSPHIGHO2_02_FULL_60_43]
MALSLRDQLLKAGLVNEKQAKQAGKQQHKQQRLVHKGQAEKDESQKLAAQQAMAEKAARDQELNRQQQEKIEQKARAAQIKQLIEVSRLPKLTTEDYYNFVDDKKVKRLSVNTLMRNKLSSGSLAIVRHGGAYEVIPREAALKIQERDPQRVVLLNMPTEAPDADDPYAAYQVPDDLMW